MTPDDVIAVNPIDDTILWCFPGDGVLGFLLALERKTVAETPHLESGNRAIANKAFPMLLSKPANRW